MGQTAAEARSSVRFSFGRDTTDEEVDRATNLVVQAVKILREARS
jgi:cysteine sulfinate desulfinase/cysteine desulfurase-like protein